MKFGYQMQQFLAARSALMLPHPGGESESIAGAFHACSRGLHDLNKESLDDTTRERVKIVEQIIDTTGLSDPDGRGLSAVKADSLTEDQRFELSRVIDDLANYFHMEFWSKA